MPYAAWQADPVTTDPTLLDDLEWRGLIAHSTDPAALREALTEGSVRFYVGFDPTAPSLHMGNLVQLLTAKRLQRAGHTPYALVGGATGMIGDPRQSGERTLNSLDTVKEWVEKVHRQIEPFLDFEGPTGATMVNNYDWTASLSTIDFLRDVGKHFPVNRMLARDVVRTRLEDGISYTEFSYILLQSMDFLNLYRDHGVRLQFGGSDQWGNLTGGVELIRRSDGGRAHAFATPLVTKADGTKYGKTEGGALWLDPQMMSPYAFHQFWLNAEDDKVGELLRIFTFLSHEEILDLEAQTAEKPFLRAGQKALADAVTTEVHGQAETDHAKAAAAALFGGGDLRELRVETLAAALQEAGVGPGEQGHRGGRPAGRDGPGEEQGRGQAHHHRGWRLPQQRADHRRRARPRRHRPDRRLLAGAAPRQEEPRGRGARLTMTARWLDQVESLAREALPEPVFRYVQEGARDEVTSGRRSRRGARSGWRRGSSTMSARSTPSTTLLGAGFRLPVGIAPMTLQRAADPEGEVAMARAAAAAGVPLVVSSNAGSTFADIAATGVTWWLQLTCHPTADGPSRC